jgi:hypothetical protein
MFDTVAQQRIRVEEQRISNMRMSQEERSRLVEDIASHLRACLPADRTEGEQGLVECLQRATLS